MKRPLPIYFIAAWSFLVLVNRSNGLIAILKSQLAEGQFHNDLWVYLRGFLAILFVWHAFRLAELKLFNRWLTVAACLWWTVTVAWNTVVLYQEFQTPLRGIAIVSAISVLNIACVWYLMRPSFRKFASQYVTEHEKEKHARDMQRISQKKILKEKI
ncbi:MAG: hypothetical protein EPO07_12690 [Verrucomicrobia bacterium]|nr:MAG: hypothetical protein EPO07_12690 [Verrucomicrobiota bacterium]